MLARIPQILRWILLLPASLGAGFLIGALIALLPSGEAGAARGITYVAAFLSGMGYVWAALHVAHAVAPSHKRVIVAVLGILILGDLSFVHLVLQAGLIPPATLTGGEENGLGVLLRILRADDYGGVPAAGLVKIGGVLAGCYIAWRKYVRGEVA